MTLVSTAQQSGGSLVRGQSRDWLVDAAILLFAVIPLFLTEHVPLFDMPNHIARQYVIRDVSTSPILQQFYYVQWALVPNLAIEIFVAAFRSFVSIENALRIFCIAALALTFLGTRVINHELSGGTSKIYRMAPLFFYTGAFQFGLLSFCFGIGVALVTFGLYLRYRKRHALVVIPVFSLAGSLILLCHMAAFGLYALAVGAFELAVTFEDNWRRSPLSLARALIVSQSRAAAHLLPPLLLFAALGSVPNVGWTMTWADLKGKASAVAALFLFSSPVWEIALFLLTAIGMMAALRAGVFRLHRSGWPMTILMVVAFLLLPRVALGTAYIDYRIPSGAIFFVLGFVIPGPAFERFSRAAAYWFSGLVLGRVASITLLWLAWEPVIDQLDDTLQQLPMGARVMVVEGWESTIQLHQPPIEHVAAFVVARRQGFEPNLFANTAAEILYLRPPFRRLYQITPGNTLSRIDPEYGYLLVLRPSLAKISPRLPLTLLASGETFALFRVDGPTPLKSEI